MPAAPRELFSMVSSAKHTERTACGNGSGLLRYRNGQIHCEDGPAVEWANGHKAWYREGRLHREGGPAVECANGDMAWYRNGRLHREDGPAGEWVNGDREWYRLGRRHRDDGPAVLGADGLALWFRFGRLIPEPWRPKLRLSWPGRPFVVSRNDH